MVALVLAGCEGGAALHEPAPSPPTADGAAPSDPAESPADGSPADGSPADGSPAGGEPAGIEAPADVPTGPEVSNPGAGGEVIPVAPVDVPAGAGGSGGDEPSAQGGSGGVPSAAEPEVPAPDDELPDPEGDVTEGDVTDDDVTDPDAPDTEVTPPVDDEEPAPVDPPAEPPVDFPGQEPPKEPPPVAGEPPLGGTGSVGPGSPEITKDLDAFHVTVIGSSTANGIGASNGDFAWVSLLDTALAARVASGYSLNNLALGGYTAADLLPGSGARGNIDDAINDKPDLLIVALAGSNDLSPGFTAEMFISQLVTVREAARAAGIPAFFMSTLPKSLTSGERVLLEEWGQLMAREFSACWIPGTAKAYAPCYIDVFDTLTDASLGLATQFDSGDGQHPNDAGHQLLFKAVDAIVEPYVCSKTDCR